MNQVATVNPQTRSIVTEMAHRFGMERTAFEATLKKTIMPVDREATNEQVAAFLVVANQYDLNPFTKEIFAFPSRGGGIQPVVSVDGWLKIINSHPEFDGMKFEDHLGNASNIEAVTCKMYRKDRTHPVEVTEYMSECRRDTDTWKKWPARMLRHKATIQAARYAFGFSGIVDPDEAERAIDLGAAEVLPAQTATDKTAQGLRKRLAVSGAEPETTAKEAETGAPTFEDAVAAVQAGDFDLARDIASKLTDSQREQIEVAIKNKGAEQ